MKKFVGLAVAAALMIGAPITTATAAHHPAAAQLTVAKKKKKKPFCKTHRCIPNFANGHGTIVQCHDGMWSHSGGRPGACSGHGGVRR